MANSEEYEQTLEAGLTALRQGDTREALGFFQHAVSVAGDHAQAADALALLGRARATLGESILADEALHEALRRAAGSPGAQARTKAQMGLVRWLQGQLDAAKYFLQEAEQELKRQGDLRNRANALGNLGTVLLTRGEYQEAVEALRESIELCEALNDRVGVAIQSSNLGELYYELGDLAQAQSLHERAIRLGELLGSESMQADALRNLGMDLLAQGQLAEGRAAVERALALAQTYHQRDVALQCRASLAEAQLMMGELEAAQAMAQELLALSGEAPLYRAQAQLVIGRCQLALRQHQRAMLTLEAGLVDAQVSASRLLVLRLHSALAQPGTHPAIAQVHRRIAGEQAAQIRDSLRDPALRERFMQSSLYKSVLG